MVASAEIADSTTRPVRTRQSTRTRSTRQTGQAGTERRVRASTRRPSTRPENRSAARPDAQSTRKSTRQTRPSTRSGTATRATSTRARPSTRSGVSSQVTQTRVRQSTRKPVVVDNEEDDSFLDNLKEKAMSLIQPILKRDELDTEQYEDEETEQKIENRNSANGLNRTDVYGERREQARWRAPLNFLFVIFITIVISVVAFALLRDSSPGVNQEGVLRDHSGEVIYYDRGNISTNTGILRGE